MWILSLLFTLLAITSVYGVKRLLKGDKKKDQKVSCREYFN